MDHLPGDTDSTHRFMKRIVLFASGSGTNVENIATYFQDHPEVVIEAVLTNRRDAKVIDRCNRLKLNVLYFNRNAFDQTDCVLNILKGMDPDLIVLAGFLWKIPANMVHDFKGKIINIHPALLPKYGGKGMYGMNVHRAVKSANDGESGISIHYVNEYYDEGDIIFQARVALEEQDTAEDIAKKVQQLEYEYFPRIIEELLN